MTEDMNPNDTECEEAIKAVDDSAHTALSCWTIDDIKSQLARISGIRNVLNDRIVKTHAQLKRLAAAEGMIQRARELTEMLDKKTT